MLMMVVVVPGMLIPFDLEESARYSFQSVDQLVVAGYFDSVP